MQHITATFLSTLFYCNRKRAQAQLHADVYKQSQ